MKCVLISMFMIVCSNAPVNLECVEYLMDGVKTPNPAFAEVVLENCKDDQGCCSHHEGISHCDDESGRFMCNDGELSPECRCEVNRGH